jgi:hypothetical protein
MAKKSSSKKSSVAKSTPVKEVKSSKDVKDTQYTKKVVMPVKKVIKEEPLKDGFVTLGS